MFSVLCFSSAQVIYVNCGGTREVLCDTSFRQECIPVGCVPSPAVAVLWGEGVVFPGGGYPGGCLPGGICPGWCLPRDCLPGGGGLPRGRNLPRRCLPRGRCLHRGCLPGGVCQREVSTQGGICPGRCLPRGVSAWGYTPLPYGQTDTCKNITNQQLLLRTVKWVLVLCGFSVKGF